MAKLRGQDLIPKDFLKHAIEEFQKLQTMATQSVKTTRKEIAELIQATKGYSAATKEGQAAIKLAEQRAEDLTKAQRGYLKSIDETEKQIVKLKAAQRQQNQINKLQEKQANSLKGSYNQLSATYSLNKIKLNAMTDEMRKNTAEGRKLERQTKSIYDRMNKLQLATGKVFFQVGKYNVAMQGATATAGRFATSLGFGGLIFGIGMAMRDGIRTMKEYEKSNAELAAVLGITRENTLLF